MAFASLHHLCSLRGHVRSAIDIGMRPGEDYQDLVTSSRIFCRGSPEIPAPCPSLTTVQSLSTRLRHFACRSSTLQRYARSDLRKIEFRQGIRSELPVRLLRHVRDSGFREQLKSECPDGRSDRNRPEHGRAGRQVPQRRIDPLPMLRAAIRWKGAAERRAVNVPRCARHARQRGSFRSRQRRRSRLPASTCDPVACSFAAQTLP